MSTRETFKPGLFGIGLNIEKKLNDRYLHIESKKLTEYIDIEPDYIKPAIRNLQAVFVFHIDSGRMRARRMLEELIKDYPDDLNALADLIYVYQQTGREKDAQKYKERLESLKDKPLFQVKSILSQANALSCDLPDDHNKNPEVFLKDSWRLLNMKKDHLKQVIKANSSVVEAFKVLKTIPEMAYEKKIKQNKLAVKKFDEGIKKLEDLRRPKEEIAAWQHNLAIARGRLATWKDKRGDETESRSENLIKALESHIYVMENLSPVEDQEESLKKYFAKSSIYFAQLYMSRKTTINNADLPESIKKKLKNVNALVETARKVCPTDLIVLQRYGRYKSNMNENMEAIKVYDKCIELVPDIYLNWFSYASRRDAYYYHSLSLKNNKMADSKEISTYLEKAYNDGNMCLQSKSTQHDMMKMAEICFDRAIPHEGSDSFDCEDINFIYEALEILHEVLINRDAAKDGKIHYLMGKYYAYISEYRKAIECLKMSLELNIWPRKYSGIFQTLCKTFIALYKSDKNRNLLSEFSFILKEAKKQNSYVTTAINMIHRLEPRMLFDLIKNMIDWDAKHCKEIIDQAMSKMPNTETLRKQFEMKLQEDKIIDCDTNGQAEIENSKSSETSERSVYDFFVLHSEEDKEWVNFRLRPQLEDYDDEIKFQGFIPSRDLKLGEKTISSILEGMKYSRKLLVILTPHHVNSCLFKYYGEQTIHSLIETKVKEKAIIPILLKDCEIPDIYKPFPPIFFNEESNWERLRMSLTVNMDSEEELEKKLSMLTLHELE